MRKSLLQYVVTMKFFNLKTLGLTLFLTLIGFVLWQKINVKPTVLVKKIPERPKIENSSNNATDSFIENLRKKTYKEANITTEETLSDNDSYSSYLIFYSSDNLKIYGVMNIFLREKVLSR